MAFIASIWNASYETSFLLGIHVQFFWDFMAVYSKNASLVTFFFFGLKKQYLLFEKNWDSASLSWLLFEKTLQYLLSLCLWVYVYVYMYVCMCIQRWIDFGCLLMEYHFVGPCLQFPQQVIQVKPGLGTASGVRAFGDRQVLGRVQTFGCRWDWQVRIAFLRI